MTTTHAPGSREEWLTARLALLDAEKELTRRRDGYGLPAARAAVTAHVAGTPVEELLVPFLATGGTMFLVAARLAFTRALRKATTKRT